MLADLSEFSLPLRRTPAILRSIYADQPDSSLDSRHASDVFSPRETLAHLIICERETWVTRVRYTMEPHKTFTSGTEIEVGSKEYCSNFTIDQMLDEFEQFRAAGIKDLLDLNLTESDLIIVCQDEEVGAYSVEELLSTWVAHDLYHMGQIFKSFSAPYQSRIGVWQQFLNLPHFN